MIGILQRQKVNIARITARHQQRQIGGFRAAVHEMHNPVFTLRHGRGEFFGEMGGDRVIEHGRAMGQVFHLILDGLNDGRVGMTDRNA